jgi:DNA-binding winged helix-turn-helix (wHTH) protein
MALAACIREIRRALDDPAHAPPFVVAVRKRGYRFLAAVTVETRPGTAVEAEIAGAVEGHTPYLTTPHNLPPQSMVFMGRVVDVVELRDLLLEEPDCRLR